MMNILETVTNTLSGTKETLLDALSDAKENVSGFFGAETTLTRKTIVVICILSACAGIIYGFLISPVKKGIQVNVTNNNGRLDDGDEQKHKKR